MACFLCLSPEGKKLHDTSLLGQVADPGTGAARGATHLVVLWPLWAAGRSPRGRPTQAPLGRAEGVLWRKALDGGSSCGSQRAAPGGTVRGGRPLTRKSVRRPKPTASRLRDKPLEGSGSAGEREGRILGSQMPWRHLRGSAGPELRSGAILSEGVVQGRPTEEGEDQPREAR